MNVGLLRTHCLSNFIQNLLYPVMRGSDDSLSIERGIANEYDGVALTVFCLLVTCLVNFKSVYVKVLQPYHLCLLLTSYILHLTLEIICTSLL